MTQDILVIDAGLAVRMADGLLEYGLPRDRVSSTRSACSILLPTNSSGASSRKPGSR